MCSSLLSRDKLRVCDRHLALGVWTQPSEHSLPQTCGRRVRERHGVFVLITPEPEHVVLAPTAVWPWCVCVCRTHRVLSLITSVNVKVSLSAYTPPASTRVCRLMRQQICQRIEPAFGQTICHRACQRHGIFHLFTRVSERDSLITGVDIEVSVLTCAPPLMSGLCLLMLPAEHEVRLAHHGTPWCKRLRLLRTAVSRYRSCPGTLGACFLALDFDCVATFLQLGMLRDASVSCLRSSRARHWHRLPRTPLSM